MDGHLYLLMSFPYFVQNKERKKERKKEKSDSIIAVVTFDERTHKYICEK